MDTEVNLSIPVIQCYKNFSDTERQLLPAGFTAQVEAVGEVTYHVQVINKSNYYNQPSIP